MSVSGDDDKEPHCIWYGVCYEDAMGRSFNCPDTDVGRLLNDKKAQDKLLKLCPDIYKSRELICVHFFKKKKLFRTTSIEAYV